MSASAVADDAASKAPSPLESGSESRLPGLFKLLWIFFMGGQTMSPVKQLLGSVFCECSSIAEEKSGSTQRNASILQKLSLIYYLDVRTQARLSFVSAFVAAVVGMLFFFYAAALAMPSSRDAGQSVNISLWAGGLTQFISAVSFFLYFKAARQFATFHVCLERMNRYLLANTICDALDADTAKTVRATLVDTIASAPMLTLDPVVDPANKPSRSDHGADATARAQT